MVCKGLKPGTPQRDAYAVVDNYHEGASPVIAVCLTLEMAMEYIEGQIKEDKQKGNNYDYGITGIAIGWDMAAVDNTTPSITAAFKGGQPANEIKGITA